MYKQSKLAGGFSLFELIIVMGIFTVVAIIATQIVTNSLSGTKKTESITTVKEDITFAMESMEREIRNAKSLDCSSSNGQILYYDDVDSVTHYFQCTNGEIVKDATSNKLTGSNVDIDCNISVFTSCTETPSQTISITVTGTRADVEGALGAKETVSTKVFVRSN